MSNSEGEPIARNETSTQAIIRGLIWFEIGYIAFSVLLTIIFKFTDTTFARYHHSIEIEAALICVVAVELSVGILTALFYITMIREILRLKEPETRALAAVSGFYGICIFTLGLIVPYILTR